MEPRSILEQGEFEFYSVSSHGITFKPLIPRDEWLSVVEKLLAMFEGAVLTKERVLMLLADALNFGEEPFGEEFAQAIDDTRSFLGLSPKTIANAQSIYRKIEPSRRRDGISLAHYGLLTKYEPQEQDRYMELIISSRLTVASLKDQIKEDHPKPPKEKKQRKKSEAAALRKLMEAADYLVSTKVSELAFEKWGSTIKKICEIGRKIRKKRSLEETEAKNLGKEALS